MELEMELERNAAADVEWLAALWQLSEEGEARCANPHLLALLRFTPALLRHPALQHVARLRRNDRSHRSQGRDRLLKDVVAAAYGEAPAHPELHRSLRALAADAEQILGAGPVALLRQARAEAAQRMREIAGELDPAADLAAATGERLALRVVLAPSVFLPPPQAGRHGVLVPRPGGWTVHLCFGFPLRQDPQQFSITRPWLLGGAWHYAIHLYLESCWPPVARQLAADPALAAAVRAALAAGAPPEREALPWTEVLRAHVNVALKCLLSRRLGLPDGVHRAFAQARGLVLFPWIEEWLLASGAKGLAEHIATLPAALAAGRPRWEALARRSAGAPPAINLALISPAARRASLVVPDHWSEEAVAAATLGWRLLPLPVLRYGEWAAMAAGPPGPPGPVIALGEPEHNPLVDRVLADRGLSLDGAAGDPAIVALSPPGFDAAPWCIAVAVTRPETAAALRMEMALKQTSTWAVLDGGAVVRAERVPLDQLTPTPTPTAENLWFSEATSEKGETHGR